MPLKSAFPDASPDASYTWWRSSLGSSCSPPACTSQSLADLYTQTWIFAAQRSGFHSAAVAWWCHRCQWWLWWKGWGSCRWRARQRNRGRLCWRPTPGCSSASCSWRWDTCHLRWSGRTDTPTPCLRSGTSHDTGQEQPSHTNSNSGRWFQRSRWNG